MEDFTKFYDTYLYESLEGTGKNRTTTCPFCEKENKFSVNVETSKGQCLSAHCGEQVNHLTFLTKFHNAWLQETTISNYQELSKLRGISTKTLQQAKLAYDSYRERWLVPYKHPGTPNLTNLGYFQAKGKNAFRIYKGPNVKEEMPLTLYNPYQLHRAIKTDTLYIAEGEWDTLAMMDILSGTKEIVIGVPGAMIFPESCRKWFDKIKHVNLVYDWDEAGRLGMVKACEILKRWGKGVRAIDWESIEGAEENYDIRDMLLHHKDTAREAIKTSLFDLNTTDNAPAQELSAGYVTSIDEIDEVESFDQYVDLYGSQLHLSEDNVKAMAITMAISTCQYMHGESLWFFLVGPPGCIASYEEVKINRAGKTFNISMKDLHNMMNGGVRGGKQWDTSIPTKIQTMNEDGTIRLRKIMKSVHQGSQLVCRVITKDGASLNATADHEFLVWDGDCYCKKPLSELKPGMLLAKNVGRSVKGKSPKKQYAFKCGIKYHPFKVWGGRNNKYKIATHRLVVEAEMNGLPLDDYVHALRHDAELSKAFVFLKPTIHVHHIDRDHTNNDLSNLEVMTDTEHMYEHAEENTKNVLEQVDAVEIVEINKNIGVTEVYDLQLRDPHNFVVNGFVVGNSGKTTLIESYGGNNEYFDYASRVTSKALVSGWNSGPEASLITKMNGKTFFIKDFTVVLGMPKEQKKEVFNLFRDIYDGTLKITFGNGKVVDLSNLSFNMIAGVTDAIKAQSDSSMGERFLRYDYMGTQCDDEAIIDSALSGFGQFNTRKQSLTEASLGYVKTLLKQENRWDLENLPRLSQYSKQRLGALARYTAYIRTRPENDKSEGLIFRPRKEIATRLALQYAKLAYALEKVFSPGINGSGGTLDLSDQTLKLIAKVAHDTAEGFEQDVMQILHQRPKIGRKDLETKLKLTPTRIHRVITDLKTLGLVQTRTMTNLRPTRGSQGSGRPSELYSVHPDFALLMDDVLGKPND